MMRRRLPLLIAVLAVVPAAQASASTVSLRDNGYADMEITGDSSVNDLRLRARGPDLVLHDTAPNASISFAGRKGRCTGEGTDTLRCKRRFLVSPIGLQVRIGAGDSFDTGGRGCRGGLAFSLNSGSQAAPGRGRATVWGSDYSDSFAGLGTATIHGCGGADLLNATHGLVLAGRGNDFASARSNATLAGGPGHDQLIAAAGGVARGGADNDELYETLGSSKLYGGPGNDQLGDRFCVHEDHGGDGRDRLFGGAGRDRLSAGCVARPLPRHRERLVPTAPDHLHGGGSMDRCQAGKRSRLHGCEAIVRLPRVSG